MSVSRVFAQAALLPSGWSHDVTIDIAGDSIVAVTADSLSQKGDSVVGTIIPGMPNVHSHAFQRAMAGRTERAGSSGDNFWAWRELMYRFLTRFSPEDCEAIATQLYIEMLKAGYTSVAEFHYLHHDEHGLPYANPAQMMEHIVSAATTAGIGLTLLPVFYAHANFGGAPPNAGQARFITDPEQFNRLLAVARGYPVRRLGIAPHSLRAVTPEELAAIIGHLNSFDPSAPIHIHAAEQQKEVDDCLAWCQRRPVAWLMDHAEVDSRWCVVHATHVDADEIVRLAKARATVGLCPSTEANLGDGIFNAPAYFAARGCWGIGGDSHVGVDPFRELALVEYAQRLTQRRRNILHTDGISAIGAGLYRQALAGGARALGQNVGAIAVGQRADVLVLNTDDAALAEHEGDSLLDAAIFGPTRHPVKDVMVGGRWVVLDGHHALDDGANQRYRATLKRLLH